MDQLEVCEAAARAGGRVLKEWRGKFAVSKKGPRDLVTEADLASQREIKRIVLGAFPDHGFIGEESLPNESLPDVRAVGVTNGDDIIGPSGLRWIVDPLDGTTNYVHGYPAYCVSVALARGDEVLVGTIYDPVREECFTARAGGGAFLNGVRIAVTRTESLSDALVAVGFPPEVTVDAPAVADFLAVLPHARAVVQHRARGVQELQRRRDAIDAEIERLDRPRLLQPPAHLADLLDRRLCLRTARRFLGASDRLLGRGRGFITCGRGRGGHRTICRPAGGASLAGPPSIYRRLHPNITRKTPFADGIDIRVQAKKSFF